MEKFRKIWLGFVIGAAALTLGYMIVKNINKDPSGPVFSGGGDTLTVSIKDDESVLLRDITAKDRKDGDVTSAVLVENLSGIYDGNKRTVTYAAFDSDRHISKQEREIAYSDYVPPRFSLTGSLRFRAGEKINIDEIIHAEDCLDGDISDKIKIRTDTSINNRLTGVYRITYEVTNSAGDHAELPVDLEIYEPFDHEAELRLTDYLIYDNGEEVDYRDYLESVRSGSTEYYFSEDEVQEPSAGEGTDDMQYIPKSLVTVTSEVDRSEPGIYPVEFHYQQKKGNYTLEAKEVMYVVVE